MVRLRQEWISLQHSPNSKHRFIVILFCCCSVPPIFLRTSVHRSRKGHVFSQSTGELLSAGTEVFIRIQVYLHCYYQYFWWSRRIFGINISNQYLFLADAVKHEHFHFYYGMLNSVPLLQLWSSISQEETWRKKKKAYCFTAQGDTAHSGGGEEGTAATSSI